MDEHPRPRLRSERLASDHGSQGGFAGGESFPDPVKLRLHRETCALQGQDLEQGRHAGLSVSPREGDGHRAGRVAPVD